MEHQRSRLLRWEPDKVLIAEASMALVDPTKFNQSKKRIALRDMCNQLFERVLTLNYTQK